MCGSNLIDKVMAVCKSLLLCTIKLGSCDGLREKVKIFQQASR